MNGGISVLMSTYKSDNVEFLKVAIDSVINQTLKPNEVVIVVDGPIPKANEQLLDEYKGKYDCVNIVKLSKNAGLGPALKRGVEVCKYEYIARMDSDDISRNDRLEKEYDVIVKKNVDIVGSNITEFVENPDNIISKRVVPESDEDIKKYLKTRCPMNHVSVLFKKSAVVNAGNYEDWHYNEDYILWIKMVENNNTFYNVQDDLVNVRVGKDMFKRRGGLKYFKSEKAIQKYMLDKRYINFFTYCINVSKRFIVQVLMTNNMRQFVFKKFARNKIKKN